jgi:hypothetical protein
MPVPPTLITITLGSLQEFQGGDFFTRQMAPDTGKGPRLRAPHLENTGSPHPDPPRPLHVMRDPLGASHHRETTASPDED